MKSQFIIKLLHKKKAIKLFIVYPDHSIKCVYALPDNNLVTYNDLTYTLNEKDFLLDSKKFICYIVDSLNPEVKCPFTPELINKVMTAEDFNTAISAKVATEIFNTIKGTMDKMTILMILGIITVGLLGVVSYLLNGKIDTLLEQLNRVEEYIKLIGGM